MWCGGIHASGQKYRLHLGLARQAYTQNELIFSLTKKQSSIIFTISLIQGSSPQIMLVPFLSINF
jgi:hypothetical protein